MRVEFINPFVSATHDVFKTMLGCPLTRGPLSLKSAHTPMYEVSGLIGLSGKCRGMVVVSVGRTTAISAAEVMLGCRPDELDRDVMDAIGELTNMIAGAAKTQLEKYQLTIGLPTVICGKAQAIAFPSQAPPIVIPFDSDLGPVCVQVGLVESQAGRVEVAKGSALTAT
jgi:chemotaxis protein CheX